MKRDNIIILLSVLWFASCIVTFVFVCEYIDHKKVYLYCELKDNIQNLFQGQFSGNRSIGNADGLFFTEFNNSPVKHFKKIPKPAYSDVDRFAYIDPELAEKMKDEWKEAYGDVSALYELNWGDDYPNQNDEGWNIKRIYCGGIDDEFIRTNIIFPYKVGLKKTERGNYYTVEEAVNEAYEFYTSNPKSEFSERHIKGNSDKIWNEIYEFCNKNEYYTIVKKNNKGYVLGTPIYRPQDMDYDEVQRVSPYENGWMHNGYYRVYIAATQENFYGIEEKEGAIISDRKKLLLWWEIGISIIFLMGLFLLCIKPTKSDKRKSETLYQRLLRLCNPRIFMDNYDKEKVDRANTIYKRLLETNAEDIETLNEIQVQVVSDLGINLIDVEEMTELKEKVNPKNYIKPYNPDKVALANELFAALSKEGLTYTEFVDIKEKSKQL